MPEITANNIDYSKVYSSNSYGDFVFLREIEPYKYQTSTGYWLTERMAEIKFLYTGTVMKVMVRDAMRGSVKDPYYPKICGVACVGNTYTNGDHRIWYNKWKAMVDRCHNPNNRKHKFYKDCTICDEWLSFEGFLKTLHLIKGYDDMITHPEVTWSLDKDILQQGVKNKVYSPSTCMFVPFKDNLHRETLDRKEKGTSSDYIGLVMDRGKYKVQPSVRTPYGPVGVFTDEIAAVNAREWYRSTYNPDAIPNTNYPYMPLDEVIKYKCDSKNKVKIYRIIGNQPVEHNYIGVIPYRYAANRYQITDVKSPYGELPLFVNQDAALNVREYYRQLYYPNLPVNTGYTYMPIEEAMRFRYRNENPKKMYHLLNK